MPRPMSARRSTRPLPATASTGGDPPLRRLRKLMFALPDGEGGGGRRRGRPPGGKRGAGAGGGGGDGGACRRKHLPRGNPRRYDACESSCLLSLTGRAS